MKIVLSVFILFLFNFCSCSKDDMVEDTTKIGVDFVWDLKHPERSPEIHLENVPVGVDHLQVQFFDATNKFEHGGGSLLYDGSGTIPAGACKEFKGLDTLLGFPKFRVTVAVFNKNGELVGKGKITKSPPDQ